MYALLVVDLSANRDGEDRVLASAQSCGKLVSEETKLPRGLWQFDLRSELLAFSKMLASAQCSNLAYSVALLPEKIEFFRPE